MSRYHLKSVTNVSNLSPTLVTNTHHQHRCNPTKNNKSEIIDFIDFLMPLALTVLFFRQQALEPHSTLQEFINNLYVYFYIFYN